MDPGGIICMGPYGPKTSKADVKEVTSTWNWKFFLPFTNLFSVEFGKFDNFIWKWPISNNLVMSINPLQSANF